MTRATFEIEHLGIDDPSRYGEFAVYRDRGPVAEFSTDAALDEAEFRPPLPQVDQLIVSAKSAVIESSAADQCDESCLGIHLGADGDPRSCDGDLI